jgi:hypothetical protein
MTGSKVPPLAALAFIALYATGTAFLGTPVPLDASPEDTQAWLQLRQDDIPVMVASFALALIPFFVLVAWTRRALPDVYGFAFLGASAAFVTQAAVVLWFYSGTAVHAETIDPEIARSLLDVASYFGPVLTTTVVVMAGAVGLAALRESSFPTWFGWVTALFAVEQLAELATVYGDSGFAAPGGAWNNVLGAGLFGLWILILGFVLSRRPAQASA